MDTLITILAFLFLISIVITIHEGGHYFAGVWAKIKILEFSIGFGKIIFQRKIGKDKTLFTLRLLPLGGFVKPLDQSALKKEDWDNLSHEEKLRSYSNATLGKRAIMVAAGPVANFILALILYMGLHFFMGVQISTVTVSEIVPNSFFATQNIAQGEVIKSIDGKSMNNSSEAYSQLIRASMEKSIVELQTDKGMKKIDFSYANLKNTTNIQEAIGIYFEGIKGTVEVKSLKPEGPAAQAGFKEGDTLKSINSVAVTDVNRLIRVIHRSANKELSIVALRNNEVINIKVIPKEEKISGENVGKLGIEFNTKNVVPSKFKNLTILESMQMSMNHFMITSQTSIVSLWRLLTGELSVKNLSGPLAIADYSGKSAKIGLYAYINMMAAISIAIGIFNLLPIPMLDGGTLAQYAIEKIRNKPIAQKTLQFAQMTGMALIVSFFSFAMFNDLSKYFF